MRRIITALLILTLVNQLYAQDDYGKLNGEWLVTKIINLRDSSLTKGKHAPINGYQKFHFQKRKLSITTSPLDKGLEQPFSLSKEGEIKLIFGIPVPVTAPEAVYTISYLSDTNLKLQANDFNGNRIEYHFERLKGEGISQKVEYKPILVKRIIYKGTRDNFVFEYSFLNHEYKHPSPIYLKGPTLGTDLSIATEYPEGFPLKKVSENLVLRFTINQKGKVQNIRTIQALNPKIDASIIKFLQKSKWKPTSQEGKPVETEITIHLRFLLEKGKLF